MRLQCERPGFHPWFGTIPWRRAWQPTPVFLPRESPRTEEPGGLQFIWSQRVGHDQATKHSPLTSLAKTLKSPLDFEEITSQFYRKSTLNSHRKNWCWSWNSNALATWYKVLTHCKRPWCWERLKAKGKGEGRGWDGWIASPTQWMWTWANSGR